MAITFGSIALAIRQNITAIEGVETPGVIRRVAKPNNKDEGGILSFVGGFLNGILGNVLNILNNISWQSVAGWIVGAAQFIFNFNWQISDDELNAAIAQAEVSWYGQLGELLGSSAGWILCGVVPGAAIGIINEAAMLRVLAEVGEEAFDEISDQLADLARLTAQQQMNKYFSQIYMGTRALIKRAANGESDTLLGGGIEVLLKFCPKSWTDAIKTWGDKGQKPWSISSGIQELIETLPEGKVQEFAEEFVDALGESCGQAIFAIGRGLDAYVLEQKMAKEMQQGKERYITVQLDHNDPKSTITLLGTEQEVESQIFAAHANYKIVKEKDLGLLVGGEPIANTITTPGLPYMKFIFSSSKDKKTKPTYIDIYNIDRTKVDNWNTLKMACGGENGYWWGPYYTEVILPDNNLIRCYARTEDEGIDLIEGLLQFSKAEQDYEKNVWNLRHEIKKGSRKKYESTYKSPRQAFPWEVIIVNQIAILNEENGKATRSGTYTSNEAKILLHVDKKPDDFEKKIQELFTTPGPNG